AAAVESKLPRVSARKLGLWLFLATEIMFFSAIIGASWTLRLRTTTLGDAFQGPWAQPGEILNVPLTGLNTFILICSSLTMVEGLAAAERGDQRKLRIFLLATLLLGMTFLSIQAFEYQKLYFGEGLTFKTAPFGVNPLYGPTFYAQTGVHGSHVTAGVLAMAYITRKAFKGGFTKENHEAGRLGDHQGKSRGGVLHASAIRAAVDRADSTRRTRPRRGSRRGANCDVGPPVTRPRIPRPASPVKGNDGLDRIRTGDLRCVRAMS